MEVVITKEEKRLLINTVNDTGLLDLSHRGLMKSMRIFLLFGLLNVLFTVPKFVWKLSNLKVLLLDQNEITELNLPKKVEKMEKLKMVDLSSNKIEQLPVNLLKLFDPLNFKMLDVSYNKLKTLPDEYYVLFQKYKIDIRLWDPYQYDRKVQDPNYPGYHGKTPKDGQTVIVHHKSAYWYYSNYTSYKIQVNNVETRGLRMNFAGNYELEEELRRRCGSLDDDVIKKKLRNDNWNKNYTSEAVRREEEAERKEQRHVNLVNEEKKKKKKKKMKEKEILNDGYVYKSDVKKGEKKKETKKERDMKKKNKTKAINREKQSKTKAKNLTD